MTCGPKGPDQCVGALSYLMQLRALRAEGNTLKDIGEVFGVSRQAIQQYLKQWEHIPNV